MRSVIHTVLLLGAVLLALACSGGCAESQRTVAATIPQKQQMPSEERESQSDVVTWEGYNIEFFREARRLTLAPLYRWPDAAPLSKYDPGDGRLCTFQVGCGMGDADRYWFATWEKAWLDSRGVDQAAAHEALRRLLTVRRTPLYKRYMDADTRKFYDDMLREAQAGHAKLFAADLQENGPALIGGPGL